MRDVDDDARARSADAQRDAQRGIVHVEDAAKRVVAALPLERAVGDGDIARLRTFDEHRSQPAQHGRRTAVGREERAMYRDAQVEAGRQRDAAVVEGSLPDAAAHHRAVQVDVRGAGEVEHVGGGVDGHASPHAALDGEVD